MTGGAATDCTTEWRPWPFRFWRFRRRWHRCVLTSGHERPCVCKCGATAPVVPLSVIRQLKETS